MAERYRKAATFEITPVEAAGANHVQSLPNYSAALLVAEVVASRGRNVLTDPKKLVDEVANAVKDARSVPEALGQLGGQYALKKLEVAPHQDFINRYHGPDFMGIDKKGRLTEAEFKGNNKNSTRLASNKRGFKQGSNKKNRVRAKQMSKKSRKIELESKRQGGAYTEKELALWRGIKGAKGKKRHIASFTNTESGKIKVFEQDEDGTLINKLMDEEIPDFEIKKQLIEEYFRK